MESRRTREGINTVVHSFDGNRGEQGKGLTPLSIRSMESRRTREGINSTFYVLVLGLVQVQCRQREVQLSDIQAQCM